jgi:hypothetical protein
VTVTATLLDLVLVMLTLLTLVTVELMLTVVTSGAIADLASHHPDADRGNADRRAASSEVS